MIDADLIAALHDALRRLDDLEAAIRARAEHLRVDPTYLVDAQGNLVLLPIAVARVQGLAALVIRGAGDES